MTNGADQDRLQEILLAYVEAVEAGRPPDPQEFLAAHPEYAADLAEFVQGYHQIGGLVSVIRQAEEPTERWKTIPAEPPGELGQLGDYRLLREVGRGGMGIVYEAEQISLRRRVALKILPFAGGADARQLQRFRNEAEAAAHLHHSHIVPVFAVGSERGVHFYAMQYIEGQSLAALIADLGGRTAEPHRPTRAVSALTTEHSNRSRQFFRTVATLGRQTAEALEYAHQMGVVHRDVKPANLLLDARGQVWIADFGLAQFQSQIDLTVSGEVLGTLRYVSPEQAMGKRGLVDHRTDVYSLGATLYELLTLRPVFDGKDRHALLHQIAFAEPPPPRAVDPTVPVELETIVLKAVAKHPGDRYGSAQELADDLERFLADKPIRAKRPNLVERTRKWARRHPSAVVAGILLLAFGLVGFAVSTVLVAREQRATKTAYDNLDGAFAKLAAEEKRTKAAYDELAAEQARTKKAYEAEATARDLAEQDFAQARRAIELVVQFSEGELAHNPGQQDVRRRLLLTVLDYYEDFIAAHADDPDIQAELALSRERVAVIVTELAGLRGSTLLAVVQDANVQKDLGLTDAQKARITQLTANPTRPPNPRDRGPRDAGGAVETALTEILTPEQRPRFQMIVLQVQQQGRYGFSDPKIVEALKLTARQREQIRKVQHDTHRAWADHLFAPDKRVKNPAEFWADVQGRIVGTLDPNQRELWQQMIGPPVAVDLREGYPWDGQNVTVPRPGPMMAATVSTGDIAVCHIGRDDFTGSGFGHKVRSDDKQYYVWKGKEIPPTAFEIAVTGRSLSGEERRQLAVPDDPPPPRGAGGPKEWLVLFRSDDPTVWNHDSPDERRFAIPVTRAPRDIRYLRLKRMDTGDALIIPVSRDGLSESPTKMDREYTWNGAANELFKARHLGIAQGRAFRPPPRPKD
ncbi:serine/threonine protein kinase [Limnoglobus roseus]|uniref:non-specific serine/threonine protein kinase n=1 Tax=Limnoglobus roseus TaxID=2598579 RepID=A0A5C1AE15_9BACT|nr:serine/threonine-protein kinase [Limnoglobus roseus]QEL16266.1 serine/threonine protein kinase [Limnoglobus roseus]